MKSGIFLIEMRDNDLNKYNVHVFPYIEEAGCSVTDKQIVDNGNTPGVLFAINAECDLEKKLTQGLSNAYDASLERSNNNTNSDEICLYSSLGHKYGISAKKDEFVPKWKMIGEYSDKATAQKQFIGIAQQYCLEGIENKIESVSEQLSDLGKVLSKI